VCGVKYSEENADNPFRLDFLKNAQRIHRIRASNIPGKLAKASGNFFLFIRR